ncbi:ATP-binding protein [Caldimonas manganoxidans]|uniref:ATP-binding protein n=1 Tax=Caldimonas manganoxidans TaxID=196015 RepID=UPI0003647DB0
MAVKPWREIAVPHEDVLKGTFQQAEFAADLSRVHAGTATGEYQNPVLFFQRTFITEGMRLLLDSVVKRLAGKGGDPVIQLQTAFGGGKTHTMLAVYHLAKGEAPPSDLPGISAILDAAGIMELPRARIAVLDGIKASPNQPVKREGQTIRTLWGDLAWQLGGAEGYALVADADASGTSPGKAVLEALLARCAPCVILIDELVAYVRQFEEGKTLTGGTFDSNLSFVQALTEALKAVPTAVLLASLPESDKEAGSQRGVKALEALAHYFGRVQALWKPVATEEAFEIVRRRLFASINDKLAMESVCRAFADFYTAHRDGLPQEVQEGRYFERLVRAYPIHPEVFERLYKDWSTLDNFQRTRGVLKLMAKVIHRLWKDGNNDLLILPGSLPLYDADVRNEAIYYLPPGWDPVIERDVDGERAETTEIENKDTRFGSVQACRRSARAVFLGSAPSTTNQLVRGLELERVILGVIQPGQQIGLFKDALKRLTDRLHYLNHANNRFWLDTRPNLRREMEERKRRFQDKEDVFPTVRERVQRGFASGVFGGIHVFTDSGDVPDDWALRLVVLPPDAAFSKSGQSLAIDRATEILKKRGDQPRFKQNRLIFLAADYDSVSRLKDHVRSFLAWRSIVADYKDNRIVLDNLMAKQANASLEQAEETVRRMIRETYKWLVAPMQEARPGKGLSELRWEHFQVNPGAQNWSQEIERVLKENELLITEWAPIHLAKVLKDWFWKDDVKDVPALTVWQQSCQQLYLPRLKDDTVFQNTMAAGAESREFFGFAQGKEDGRYIGFSYGKRTSLIMDSSLLLIEPLTAAAYMEALRASEEASRAKTAEAGTGASTATAPAGGGETSHVEDSAKGGYQAGGATAGQIVKKQFYGSIDLDPILAKKQFADLVDEVVQQFTLRPDVKVKIAIEIQAESPSGFDDGLQRVVKENCNVLKFKNAEFESGE